MFGKDTDLKLASSEQAIMEAYLPGMIGLIVDFDTFDYVTNQFCCCDHNAL